MCSSDLAALIIWHGLELFRKNKKRSYYSSCGNSINKPTPSHNATIGRNNQADVRTILISALCRAWVVGTGKKPTLNNKKDFDSAFMTFASHILASEGIGHIHKHLEEYWSRRKKDWFNNDAILREQHFRGE